MTASPLTSEEVERVRDLVGRMDHPGGPDALAPYLPGIVASLDRLAALKKLAHGYVRHYDVLNPGNVIEAIIDDALGLRRQVAAARAGRCEFDGCVNAVTMCEDHLEGEASEGARTLEEQNRQLLNVVRDRAKLDHGGSERRVLRDLGLAS